MATEKIPQYEIESIAKLVLPQIHFYRSLNQKTVKMNLKNGKQNENRKRQGLFPALIAN